MTHSIDAILPAQLEVKKDKTTGDLYLDLPPSVLEALGADIGDPIKFHVNDDKTITIKKIKYTTVEIDVDSEELAQWMCAAHEAGLSFNEFVERALIEFAGS